MSSIHDHSDVGSNSSVYIRSWFAVSTVPRHEKRVKEYFTVREIESFLPLYQTQYRWKDGSKGTLLVPLFASYIFVRINRGERVSVLEVPGVTMILGGGRESWAVPDSYIHFLQEGLRQKKVEPHPYLVIGTRVRIRAGLMVGMEGVLLRKKNNFHVVLTLEMIMKSITVEVPQDCIEPVV